MNIKDTLHIVREVARVDGFLAGLASMNGGLRDYSSFCYIVHIGGGHSIDEAIKNYYQWLPQLRFSSVRQLDGGVRDLEDSLGPYLVRGAPRISQSELLDLRHHLSFKVMEMMSAVLMELGKCKVFELLAESEPHSSQSVFYGICAEHVAVVLQFNDDVGFESVRE